MADNKEERRKKAREDSSCKNPAPSLREDLLPVGRRTPDCDVPVAPTTDEFKDPAPCPPAVTPNTVLPDPLEILNAEVTETCPAAVPKNGPEGDDVVIPAGTYAERFFFTSITGITGNQLTFISTLSAPERAELAEGATVNRIIELTGLSTAQATELNAAVAALQIEVDAIAAEAAYGAIICFWENTEQEVECPAGAILSADVLSLPLSQRSFVHNPSTIAAGTFTSTVSQAEANIAALAAATDALLCLFGNDEVTRTCLDLGFIEDVTDVDLIADTLDGQVRKGSVTIAENTVFSTTDVASANIAAEAIADSQLSCFYINPQVTVTCAGEGLIAGIPGTTGPPIGDAIAGIGGQVITVPAGFLTSTVSTVDAENLAREYALSLLVCWICNNPVTVTCPDQLYVDKYGVEILREPSITSSPLSVTIPACFIRSEIGQQDADDRAIAVATAQLNCIYCNPLIAPTCVPTGYENPPVDLGEYNRATWSRDATTGQLADIYCCVGSGGAQNCYEIAEAVATIPIDAKVNALDCRYGNDPQWKDCLDGPIYDWIPYDVPFEDRVRITTGHRGGGTAYIPADTFFVLASAGGKAQANSLALNLVEGAISCWWHNIAQRGECPPNMFSDLLWLQPEKTIKSFESQEEADALAKTIADSKSVCQPFNPAQYGNVETGCACLCEEDEVLVLCPTIPPDTVRGSTQEEADQTAADLCSELVVCAPKGTKGDAGPAGARGVAGIDGMEGMPGNSGAQTGCGGTCYGYYST